MSEKVPRTILLGLTGLDIGGGIASVSRCILRTLREDLSQGHLDRIDRVLLLENATHDRAVDPREIEWRCGGSQSKFFRTLWRAILRRRPDFVLFDHLGLARALLPQIPSPRPRYGIFVHGGELVAVRDRPRLKALSRADCLLANSAHTERAIRELPTLAETSPRVVPLCIEPDRLSRWSSLREVPIERPRQNAVLIVGRMVSDEPGKGHDALLECWPSVRRQVPDAQLWVVGTGDDRNRLESKAASLGESDHIFFLGGVSDEKLSELYRTAAVFAMPSRQEGFGLVYLEAMWHGLPCIGSTADAASCLIDDTCGRLVPYGDAKATASAIEELLLDPSKRECSGEAARKRSNEDFSFDRFAQELRRGLGLVE